MILDAIVEMPTGTNYKYEFEKTNGRLVLDRVLNIQIPFNYGFVPHTLCEDGDPLDIFVVSAHPIFPGAQVQAEIVGAYVCNDNGASDDKIIAVLKGETVSNQELDGVRNFIEYYLTNYKSGFQVLEFKNRSDAERIYWASLRAVPA